jgi:type IV fimbrial biogenesis protein FimT
MRTRSNTRADGFTLIELLAAVAVLAILAGIAVPSFNTFTVSQRLRAASFDLRTDLTLARSEALKRNSNVVLQRRLADGWQTGWTVTVAATNEILRSRNDVGSGVSVTAGTNAITFNGNGRVSSPAGTVQFALGGTGGNHRCLTLDPAGMPRTRTQSCS